MPLTQCRPNSNSKGFFELMPNQKYTITSNQRFTRLVVKSREPSKDGKEIYWLCVCDCGTEKRINEKLLTGRYRPKSCGCLERGRKSAASTVHGMHGTPEYHAWGNMIARCGKPHHPDFKNYGGRGIVVCPAWGNFKAFFKDMGSRPSDRHSLDRADNDGNYEPGNVRWALRSVQNNNSRQCRRLTYQGRTQNLTQWATEVGINIRTLKSRLDDWHWPLERALTERVHKRVR